MIIVINNNKNYTWWMNPLRSGTKENVIPWHISPHFCNNCLFSYSVFKNERNNVAFRGRRNSNIFRGHPNILSRWPINNNNDYYYHIYISNYFVYLLFFIIYIYYFIIICYEHFQVNGSVSLYLTNNSFSILLYCLIKQLKHSN